MFGIFSLISITPSPNPPSAPSVFLTPLGLVMVDCRNVKKVLVAKQKRIAAELFEVLEKKTKEYADSVMDEFK